MKDNKLYSILDLIEEIDKVDKMIYLHSSSKSDLMLNQYKNQKLKDFTKEELAKENILK